jgi:hypothetical protein
VGTISRTVNGNGGALLFAGGGTAFDSVKVSSDVDFAAAEFRYADVPEPPTLSVGIALCAVGLLRRKTHRSKSSAK